MPIPNQWLATAGLVLLAACAPARQRPLPASVAIADGPTAARADSLRYPYVEADVRFMQEMIHHHAQAILISRWAPTHDASPAVQRLAARIINAQTDDITLMRNWLIDRGRPAASVDAEGNLTPAEDPEDEHAGHDMDHEEHLMPGMLSPSELRQLDAARGNRFDELFLSFMIKHHRGAVTMVQELIGTSGAAQDETVFRFAAEVEVDQSTEIRRMIQMLLELGGTPPA